MKPQVVLSDVENKCSTFTLSDQLEHYIGYSVLENTPRIIEGLKGSYDQQPTARPRDIMPLKDDLPMPLDEHAHKRGWRSSYMPKGNHDPVQLMFHASADQRAECVVVDKERGMRSVMQFEPVSDGVRLTMQVNTEVPIESALCVQQCLRFTGKMNDPWRLKVAHIPYLSELDMQAMGNANGTLTFSRRDDEWMSFPVEHRIFATKSGAALDQNSSGIIDHGLIIRESPKRTEAPDWYWERVAPDANWAQVVSGMYWERTAFVSNRHPADCVHSWFDVGPLDVGEVRVVRGKFYYLEGSKDDLLQQFELDFPVAG
jgi:hypothetical protein